MIFWALPFYHGGSWYDWGYVEYVVQSKQNGPVCATYPSKILGFVKFPKDQVRAAIITSSRSVPWERRVRDFITPFRMSYDNRHNYAFVPLSAILFLLLVFPDVGGSKDRVFCAIPKRNWGDIFDTKIVVMDARHTSVECADAADGIGAEPETSVNDKTTRIMGRLKAGSEGDMWSSDSDRNGWDDSSDSD